ncbi:uncharacterized protein [Drosophila tropicalis]|uniref:uncharacterized protein n=1 Tax=Drosophila tropicalis TaxID=46794 RepID=UPI0035ABDD8C
MLDRLLCMRLKTAGYVFGWIDIIGNILAFIVFVLFMFDPSYEAPVAFSLLVMTLISTKILIALLLLLGIKKQRHRFLLPWLVLFGILLIALVFCSSVIMGFEFVFDARRSPELKLLLLLLIVIPSWLFGLYIFYGMYSLYKEIQAIREEQQAQFSYVQCTLSNKQEGT